MVGGTAYTVSQADVVDNLREETGMSQQEAQEFVEQAERDGLVSWDKVGESHIEEGESTLTAANQIDCDGYIYEWESSTLSCAQGKAQLQQYAKYSVDLGNAYKKLSEESAGKAEMRSTVGRIDNLNNSLQLEIVQVLIDAKAIEEIRNTNAYNKSLLRAIIENQ